MPWPFSSPGHHWGIQMAMVAQREVRILLGRLTTMYHICCENTNVYHHYIFHKKNVCRELPYFFLDNVMTLLALLFLGVGNHRLPMDSQHKGSVTHSFVLVGTKHIRVSKLTVISSENDLSPDRRQAIIWTNAGILLIGALRTNFSEILIAIDTFPFKKMHFKISPEKWRPFWLGLNVLKIPLRLNILLYLSPWSTWSWRVVYAPHSNRWWGNRHPTRGPSSR